MQKEHQLRHFGRKGEIEHIDFHEVPKSIFEGLGRFTDNHKIKFFAENRKLLEM